MAKHNDAGGGMTVKEAVITSVKVAVLIGVLYVVGYFAFVGFASKQAIYFPLTRFLIKTLHLYPNSRMEDLYIEDIEGMSLTVLILCAIFIPVALYRKIKKQ